MNSERRRGLVQTTLPNASRARRLWIWIPAGILACCIVSLAWAEPEDVPEVSAPIGSPVLGDRVSKRPDLRGPLAVRNLHPFFLPFYQPSPERAHTLAPGKLRIETRIGYASLQRADQEGPDFSFYDGEVLRTALHVRYGLFEQVELSLELPFITTGPGFLDPLIKDFHNSTGFTEDQRDHFNYHEILSLGGDRVIDEGRRNFHLGDVPLQLKYQVLEDGPDAFGLSLRGALELPTGRSPSSSVR